MMAPDNARRSGRTFEELVELSGWAGTQKPTLERNECLAATREYATACRGDIRARHAAGASGSNVVRMLSDTTDRILRGTFLFGLTAIAGRRTLVSRVSLCARGGYGRSELSPCSDLDVCLIYEGQLTQDIKDLNAFLISFLWDIGFEVGYTLLSVREAMDLAREDIPTFTSFLESRLVAGTNTGFGRLKLFMRELQSGPLAERFIEQKIKERHESLPEQYRDLYHPEPNVKESAGGLRDFHTALWLLMMAYELNTLDEAVGRAIITSDEHLDFVEALSYLWRIRNELHFHTNESDDLLSFANQRHVAKAFGYGSGKYDGVSKFMQDYYGAAAKLRRFLRLVARTCDSSSILRIPAFEIRSKPDVFIQNGEIFAGLGDADWFAHNPARLMRVFWEATKQNVHISHLTERLLTQNLHLAGDSFRSSEVVRRLFVAICNRPLLAGRQFRQASQAGLLGQYIPEFAAVSDVIRYSDFHHFPVGEHTLRAVEALTTIHDMAGPIGSCLQEALDNLSDPYILIMAILFHDLGKVQGDVHTAESVRIVRQICRRMDMPEEDGERIAFLVEHHTLMSTISQYRDIDDEDIVRKFAETMKTEQRLRALFLLTFADMFAVAPNVWNDWKGALLLQLYLRTVKHLLGRAESVGEEFWKSEKADRIRKAAPKDLVPHVEDHLRGLGDRYFVAFTAEQIALHLECVHKAQETGLAVHAMKNTNTSNSDVVICTRDRHGLFAKIAGSFSARLADIASAALFTRPDGWVVDRFAVTDARQRRPLTSAQLTSIEQVLRAVLLEERDIQEYVDGARRRLFALLQPRIPVQTRIEFDNHSSRLHTVIDVETGDRTGVLYDIAHAMAEFGLDIVTARIVTDVRHVRDSFYVTRDNKKIELEEQQHEIRETILNAIHPRSAVESGRTKRS